MSTASDSSPDVGLVLNSRYRVESMIARGGMATVYRGFDERLERPVALKIMHPHLVDSPEFITRFAREARSAARLNHPHVVGVYDQGEDRGRVYLAMELVEGETIRDELRREGALTLRRALMVGRDVLAALDAAHRSGIIHRDIKPENVLVNHDGAILVTDFGLARAVGSASTSASGMLMGTVAYVSPEVVTRGVSDARSDLYSWGIMMFELMTGRTPFQGDSPVHIAYQHAHDDIPAPSTLNPALPRSIDALVTWAAARLPSSRPARAHEVLLALDEALETLSATHLDARAPWPGSQDAAATHEVPALTRDVPTFTSINHDPDPHSEAAHSGSLESRSIEHQVTETPQGGGAAAAGRDAGILAFLARTRTAGAKSNEDPRGIQQRAFTPDDSDGDREPADEGIRELHFRPLTRPRGWRTSQPRRSPLMRVLALVLATLALVSTVVAAQQWYTIEGPGADRVVPLLAGASLADAESALGADDLLISTRYAHSDTVAQGHVIDTEPLPGTTLKRGSTVVATISLGQYLVTVPTVTGLEESEAQSALERAGFEVDVTREYSETVEVNHVIAASDEGEDKPPGETITLTLSDGPEPIAIPNVTGSAKDAAHTTLRNAGFEVSSSNAYSASVPAGVVISQDPSSGTARRGAMVSIVVSLGPEMLTVPDVFQLPEAQARQSLESAGFSVAVNYDRGTPVLGLTYAQSVAAGEKAPRGSTITINVF